MPLLRWITLATLAVLAGCHEDIEPVECTRTADCLGERVCFDGRCLVSCSGDRQCLAMEMCNVGVCQPLDRRERPDGNGGGDPRGGDGRPGDARVGDPQAPGDNATAGDESPAGAPLGGACTTTPDCAAGLKCDNDICCSTTSGTCCDGVEDCAGDSGCVRCDNATASCVDELAGTDCDTCGACDGTGGCVYDSSQDDDCYRSEPTCGQCSALGQCTYNDGASCSGGRTCDDAGRCIVPSCVTLNPDLVLNCTSAAANAYCASCSTGTPTYSCSSVSDERWRCNSIVSACSYCNSANCCSGTCVTDITCD